MDILDCFKYIHKTLLGPRRKCLACKFYGGSNCLKILVITFTKLYR